MGKFPPRAPWVRAPDWDRRPKTGKEILDDADREAAKATRRVGLVLVALYVAVCLLLTL